MSVGSGHIRAKEPSWNLEIASAIQLWALTHFGGCLTEFCGSLLINHLSQRESQVFGKVKEAWSSLQDSARFMIGADGCDMAAPEDTWRGHSVYTRKENQ